MPYGCDYHKIHAIEVPKKLYVCLSVAITVTVTSVFRLTDVLHVLLNQTPVPAAAPIATLLWSHLPIAFHVLKSAHHNTQCA